MGVFKMKEWKMADMACALAMYHMPGIEEIRDAKFAERIEQMFSWVLFHNNVVNPVCGRRAA